MPGKDGTGPRGMGPRGRQMGPCRGNAEADEVMTIEGTGVQIAETQGDATATPEASPQAYGVGRGGKPRGRGMGHCGGRRGR
jgi:hypothetical protein